MKVENQTYPYVIYNIPDSPIPLPIKSRSKVIEKYLMGDRSPAVIKSYQRFMFKNEEVHPSLDT